MVDLKFIVSEVNKLINTDYNMISFDALPIENVMQILVDVLHNFGALSKVIYQLKLRMKLFLSGTEQFTVLDSYSTIYGLTTLMIEANVKMILMRFKLIINKNEIEIR